MKTQYLNARSVSLPKGVPVKQFDTMKEILDHVKGNESNVVDVINKYGRQKDCFPEALELMSDVVAGEKGKPIVVVPEVKVDGKVVKPAINTSGLGFPAKTRTEKKDGKEVQVRDESDAEHINRWVEAEGNDTAQKKAWAHLQSVIDMHGDFVMDLNAAVRAGGKGRKIPDYLIEGATNIINNGNEKAWATKLTAGYDTPQFGHISPVDFQPFDTKAPKGSTPEQVEAIRKANIENLARALMQVEEQKREYQKSQQKKEYV